MTKGAVALLDVLGWKGIWSRKDDAIGDLFATVSDVKKRIVASKRVAKSDQYWSRFKGLETKLILISDTIAITIVGDEGLAIELATHLVASIIAHGLRRGLPIRGAISAGDFHSRGTVFVGPAIDEVAAWYEQTDWIGAILTPSADLVVDRHGPRFTGMVVLYNAPVKTSVKQSYYCVDWTFRRGRELPDLYFGRNTLSDQLRELMPIMPEFEMKIRNTIDFYDTQYIEATIRGKKEVSKFLRDKK